MQRKHSHRTFAIENHLEAVKTQTFGKVRSHAHQLPRFQKKHEKYLL
jgi:hypothetical protein